MTFKLIVSAITLVVMCLAASGCSFKADSPSLPRPIFEVRFFMPRDARPTPAVVAEEHEVRKY
jgi:hypothetical protein